MTLIIFSVVAILMGIIKIASEEAGSITLIGVIGFLTLGINQLLINLHLVQINLMDILSIDNVTNLLA